MLLSLMILGCLTALAAAIVQWIKERNNGEKHHNYTLLFVFIGTVIATTVSIIQSIESEKSEKELAKSNVEIIKLQKRIGDSTDKVISLYSKLSDAQSKIIELEQENLSEIKGGNNKPRFGWGCSGYSKRNGNSYEEVNDIRFYLQNRGKYHIRNINVSIRDIYNNEPNNQSYVPVNAKTQIMHINDFVNFRNYELKSLSPNNTKTFYIGHPKDSTSEKTTNYQIAIEWDNGYYYVNIDFVFKNGNMVSDSLQY